MAQRRALEWIPAGHEIILRGPRIAIVSDVSRGDFVVMCRRISDELCASFRLPSRAIRIAPEPIAEGGLVYSFNIASQEIDAEHYCFTGPRCRANVGYKSLRFSIPEMIWPRVSADVMSAWDYNDEVVIPAGMTGRIVMYCTEGAPQWTAPELDVFRRELLARGIRMR
jgi:hypothetical protein